MNSRERLMAALSGKEPDRLSWAPLIDEYYTGSLGEQGLCMDVIDTIKYIGADIIYRHALILKGKPKNVEYRITRNGDEEQRLIETPVGTVEARYRYSGHTSFTEKHPLTTIEDLKVMQYVMENSRPESDYENFFKLDERVGESGIVSVSTPLTPIQALLQHSMGIEAFTYFLYDFPSEIEEYMQVVHDKQLKEYKLMAEAPEEIKVFISYEDTSTTVLGPEWYNKYCRGYIDDYADIMHKGNKIFITHMCGKLKNLTECIGAGRMDGIDSVCPPTTGDLWAHEALERMPGKIILGGLEPSALRRMNAAETKAYARKVIEACLPYRKFLLSTGDATAYGTPLENLRTITELVSEYSRE